MSLNFTSNGYLNVVGSADLLGGSGSIWANAGTFLCWVLMNNVGPAAAGRFVSADGANFFFNPTPTIIQITHSRGTQSMLATGTYASMPAVVVKQWACIAATWDLAGTSAQQQLWAGNLKYPMAETTAYGTQRVGSGAATVSAANPAFGNAAAGGLALDGLMAYAVAFNRRLSLPELQWMQFHPMSPLPGCVGLWNFDADAGAAFTRDFINKGNGGFVTGASVGSGMPMPGGFLSLPKFRKFSLPALGTLFFSTLTETLTLTDTLTKQPQKALSESLTFSDTLTRLTGKVLTETLSLTDTLAKLLQRTFTETITFTDTLSAFKTKIITLLEAITLSDVLVKMPGKALTETLTLTDTLNRSISFVLLETLTLVDTVNRRITRTFAESIVLTDTLNAVKVVVGTVKQWLNLLGIGQ